NLALARLDSWVPKLGLYKCRSARGGYEAVAHWRESSTGRALQVRARNLSIVPKGIKDFGDGRNGSDGLTYTPLDLVMAANGCALAAAFRFLSDHAGWVGGRIILVEAATAPEPAPTAVETPTKERADSVPAEAKTEAPVSADELEPYTHGVPGVVGEA